MHFDPHKSDPLEKDLFDAYLFDEIENESRQNQSSSKYTHDPIALLILSMLFIQLFSCFGC